MVERVTAKKCSAHDLATGRYVAKSGTEPNYVETPHGPVSRANLIAVVVEKAGRSLVLDDSTGRIEARSFDDERLFEKVATGTIVLLIGRPREYQGQRYLAAEICKPLQSPAWLGLRRAELGHTAPTTLHTHSPQPPTRSSRPNVEIEQKETEKVPETVKSGGKAEQRPTLNATKVEEMIAITADKLLEIIRQLDDGKGAPVEQVIAKAGRADAETMLTNLLAEGEIFELRPGRVKVLE